MNIILDFWWFPLAAIVVVFAPAAFPLYRGMLRKKRQRLVPRSTTRRLIYVLVGTAVMAVVVGAAVRALGLQQFAAFGLTKRLVLPALYGVFFVVALVLARKRLAVRPPLWWWALLVIVSVSTCVEIVFPRQSVDLLDVAQSVLLCIGVSLLAYAGMWSRDWGDADAALFLYFFGLVALIQELFAVSATPYDVVTVPIGFALVYWGLKSTPMRLPAIVLGFGLICLVLARLANDTNASIAHISQVVACIAVFAVLALPRFLRLPSLCLMLVVTIMLAIGTGYWKMLVGVALPAWDVTLTHRAYETQVVLDGMSNPLTLLFGLGAGGTVDLALSPDARTLIAAGRDISAVDDVHLLTSWVMLKFGVCGFLWLAVVFAGIFRQTIRVVSARRGDSIDAVLLMFVLAGSFAALPAATYLFSNPLFAFALGCLIARDPASMRQLDLSHATVKVFSSAENMSRAR